MAPATRSVYLLGGGWGPASAEELYGPFVAECDGPIALVVEDGPDSDAYAQRYVDVLARCGASGVRVCKLGAEGPPAGDDLASAAGVLVGGGLTPAYHRALAEHGTGWLAPDVPYLGFSAGAAIAPDAALIGGWLAGDRAVCNEDNAEDLQELTVRPGLGLVPWTIDVHASQWGNLSRLVHALREGGERGFAIDEDTGLVVRDGGWTVTGAGFVYEAARDGDGVHVRTHTRGATGA